MNIKSILAGAILAAGAVLAIAPRAQAQTIAPIIEYKTQGGFIAFSVDMKVYSTGLVACTEQYMNGQTLLFTGNLTARQLTALKAKEPSNFASLPASVYFAHNVADIPTRIVTVGHKTVSWVGMGGRPVADAKFQAFVAALGDAFNTIASQEFCSFSSAGGLAFQQTILTVKNNGQCHLTTHGAIGDLDKDGYLSVADLTSLKKIFARSDRYGNIWARMPDFLLSGADMIVNEITAYGHTVQADDPAHEWLTYKMLEAAFQAAVQTVKTQ